MLKETYSIKDFAGKLLYPVVAGSEGHRLDLLCNYDDEGAVTYSTYVGELVSSLAYALHLEYLNQLPSYVNRWEANETADLAVDALAALVRSTLPGRSLVNLVTHRGGCVEYCERMSAQAFEIAEQVRANILRWTQHYNAGSVERIWEAYRYDNGEASPKARPF